MPSDEAPTNGRASRDREARRAAIYCDATPTGDADRRRRRTAPGWRNPRLASQWPRDAAEWGSVRCCVDEIGCRPSLVSSGDAKTCEAALEQRSRPRSFANVLKICQGVQRVRAESSPHSGTWVNPGRLSWPRVAGHLDLLFRDDQPGAGKGQNPEKGHRACIVRSTWWPL